MSSYSVLNIREQGGDNWEIGGTITIVSGGAIVLAGGAIVPASGTQAAAITLLTDGSGGTSNDAIQAVGATNGGDVSAAINNNFADLAAKLNAVITAINGVGIIA